MPPSKATYQQTQADTSSASTRELSLMTLFLQEMERQNKPIMDRLDRLENNVNARLDSIDKRLSDGDKRLDGHSDFIEGARPIIEEAAARRLLGVDEPKRHRPASEADTERMERKPKRVHPLWWVILAAALGGLGTKAGEQAWDRLFGPQQAIAQQKVTTP